MLKSLHRTEVQGHTCRRRLGFVGLPRTPVGPRGHRTVKKSRRDSCWQANLLFDASTVGTALGARRCVALVRCALVGALLALHCFELRTATSDETLMPSMRLPPGGA
eukprot:7742396-Pyramimonas_sp.AAC.1